MNEADENKLKEYIVSLKKEILEKQRILDELIEQYQQILNVDEDDTYFNN